MINKNYRPDIDGLRAIAVISVLLFHLDVPGFGGGFVGVDVFFVISGFLITGLIKSEIDKTGAFNFKTFYVRRIRRLFPALFATLIVTAFFSALILSPVHLQRFGGALTSSLASVSNFYFWLEADYFDVSARLKPLLHTWSLSIEEQFYLIWPVSLFLLIKLKKKWLAPFVLLLAAGFSLYINVTFSDGSVSLVSNYSPALADAISEGRATIFFLMPFRIFEFAIGAILVWLLKCRVKSKLTNELLLFVGLGLIGCSVVAFSDKMLFPSYFALLPCLGTALAIYAGQNTTLSKLLTNKVSVGVGLISYSLYLVHWPLIVFYTYLKNENLLFVDKALIAISAICLGYLSYLYIEQPFRSKKIYLGHIVRKGAAVITILMVASIGVSMNQNGGWAWRIDSPIVLNTQSQEEHFEDYYGGSGYPKFGPVGNSTTADVVLIGDSHARHYAEGIYKEFSLPYNRSLYIVADLSCFKLPKFTRLAENYGDRCDRTLNYAVRNIIRRPRESGKPPIVITSYSWLTQMKNADYLDRKGNPSGHSIGVNDIIFGLRKFKYMIGKSPLIVIGNVPTTGRHNLYDVFTRPRYALFSDFKPEDYLKSKTDPEILSFNQRLSQEANATDEFLFLDPHEVLCNEGECSNVDEQNRLIYSDTSHLSKVGARLVIRGFLPEIKEYVAKTHLN